MDVRIPTLVPLGIDLERIAERARRRDLFAAAALAVLASDRTIDGSWDDIAVYAVRAADALLARLDATAGPTSVNVPLPPTPPMLPTGGVFWSESEPVLVTTEAGERLVGRCLQYHDRDPQWVTVDKKFVIHGVVGWGPIPPSPATRPVEVE